MSRLPLLIDRGTCLHLHDGVASSATRNDPKYRIYMRVKTPTITRWHESSQKYIIRTQWNDVHNTITSYWEDPHAPSMGDFPSATDGPRHGLYGYWFHAVAMARRSAGDGSRDSAVIVGYRCYGGMHRRVKTVTQTLAAKRWTARSPTT